MDIPLIDDPAPDANPAVGIQYAVRDPDGDVSVYGDQRWVASGRVITDAHPDGVIVQRTVTVTYGGWIPAPGGAS